MTPGRIPSTPKHLLASHMPGGAAKAPQRIPTTPRALIPQTPAGPSSGGSILGVIPKTPAGPLSGGDASILESIPRTPGGALGGGIPQTPAGAFGGGRASDPLGDTYGASSTPSGYVPGTPGLPGPLGRAGVQQKAPVGGSGYAGGASSALSTPLLGATRTGQLAAQAEMQAPAARVPTFSDGSECTSRHAPRKKRGTGEKLPAPIMAFSKPTHWTNPEMGEKARPPPEEPIPDFNKWRKIRKNEGGAAAGGIKGMTPAFTSGVTPMHPQMVPPQTPGLPARQPLSGGRYSDVTPFLGGGVEGDLLRGDTTPFLTPGLASKAGEMTPALPAGIGVGQLHGRQTPLPGSSPAGMFMPPDGGATPRVSGHGAPR